MNKSQLLAGAAGACLLASTTTALAEQESRFSYEMELELGVSSVIDSDVAANEITDVYGVADVALEFAISDRVTFFTGLTFESVLDPVADRTFEDMGLYIGEIGLSFAFGDSTVSVGKISPAFGIAWDAAPGYFGADYAGDYELGEMIGATGEFAMGDGTLTAAVFYMDNTKLSDSWGTNRGRNTTAAGGAGNTGKLNNFAVTYALETGNTTFAIGARHLTAGFGDAKDETGFSLGLVHSVSDSIEIVAEIASFQGFGGSTDDAKYATLGASFNNGGPVTYSASFTRRDITSSGVDQLIALGLDYEMKTGATLSAGLGFTDEGGVKSRSVGLAVVFPLGG